jgi:hypothetical protein
MSSGNLDCLGERFHSLGREIWDSDVDTTLRYFDFAIASFETLWKALPRGPDAEADLGVVDAYHSRALFYKQLGLTREYSRDFEIAVERAFLVVKEQSEAEYIGEAYLLLAEIYQQANRDDLSLKFAALAKTNFPESSSNYLAALSIEQMINDS